MCSVPSPLLHPLRTHGAACTCHGVMLSTRSQHGARGCLPRAPNIPLRECCSQGLGMVPCPSPGKAGTRLSANNLSWRMHPNKAIKREEQRTNMIAGGKSKASGGEPWLQSPSFASAACAVSDICCAATRSSSPLGLEKCCAVLGTLGSWQFHFKLQR